MVKIGMVGVGAISGIYLKNITGLFPVSYTHLDVYKRKISHNIRFKKLARFLLININRGEINPLTVSKVYSRNLFVPDFESFREYIKENGG